MCNAKFDQLSTYINYLQQSHCKFDAILLQETWLRDNQDIDYFNLDNYSLISNYASCSSHGGLAIYLRNEFTYDRINIDFMNSNTSEGLFVKVRIIYCFKKNLLKSLNISTEM